MNRSNLQEHNPWWRVPEFILEDNYLAELERQRHRYYHPLYRDFPLNREGILTLRGPRRIGKTTLLKLLIRRLLLDDKVGRDHVFFYPCDTVEDFKELEELLLSYLTYIRPRSGKHLYLFLDEISFVREWQRAVKLLADTGRLKGTTLLISGSSSLDLRFSAERLPGRRGEIFPWDIEYLPLTFREFVTLLKHDLLSSPLEQSLDMLPHFHKLFDDYLICGGFPMTINEYFEKGYISPQTYEIFIAWIEGDLHRVGKSESSAYQIIRRLFIHLAGTVSFYKLSRESGIASHTTVEDYLDILEKMFIIHRLPCFSIEAQQVFFRKNRKFYFADPFILNCLKAKIDGFQSSPFIYSRNFTSDDSHRPALVENATAAHFCRASGSLYYGRSGKEHEIDFVHFLEGHYSFYEVKYQAQIDIREFAWAEKLIGKRRLMVLSRKDYQEGNVLITPAELFLAYYDPKRVERNEHP